MPPKRKPADSSSSSPTTTTPTSTPTPTPASSNNGKKSAKPPKKDDSSGSSSSESEEEDILIDSSTKKQINWYWAGDSKSGSQDNWVAYGKDVARKLETAYQKYQALASAKAKEGARKAKVDDDRYVDLKKMLQRRYDDKSKKRAVNRLLEDPKAKKGPNAPPATREGTKKKKKAASDDDSDSGSAKKKVRLNPKKKKGSDSDYSASDDEDDVVSTDEDDDDSDDEYVKWSWAGDSGGGPSKGGGHQDIWLVYSKKLCKKLEKGFNLMKKRVKVDKERFVDMQNMLQRRYDDESKRRSVKREDPPKKKVKAPTPKVTPKATTTTKKGKKAIANDDESDEESDEDDKKKKTTKKTSSSLSSSPATTTTTTSSSAVSLPPIVAPPSPPSITSIINSPSNWTKQTAMTYVEVDLDKTDPEFVWMQDLFTSTIYPPHKTNPGLSPITFKTLQVTRVVRVQNPVTWMRYHSRKATVLMDAKGKCSPTLSKVLTVHPKGPPVDVNANEFFLFHGLNINSVIGICKFGFDPRFCSLQGMFGAGLYFAENSSKSNQYCHAGACTNSGAQAASCRCTLADELCLLVCRVTLGDPLVENIFRGNNPGDFWYNKRTEPKKSDNISIYNSVVGESKANYGPAAALMLREYIVYESSQVYPEYKVYYKRVK